MGMLIDLIEALDVEPWALPSFPVWVRGEVYEVLEGRKLGGECSAVEVLGKEGLWEVLEYGNHKFLLQEGNGDASAELS